MRLGQTHATTPDQEPSLRVIVGLTRHMLQIAQYEDWLTLVSLEEARSELIAAFFAQPVADDHASDIANGIREILAMDQEIMLLSEGGQQQAVNGLRQLHRATHVIQAYGDGQAQMA